MAQPWAGLCVPKLRTALGTKVPTPGFPGHLSPGLMTPNRDQMLQTETEGNEIITETFPH